MLVTRNPTARTTPDPSQGGDPVTGDTNTGHAATNVISTSGAGSSLKTCIWQGFNVAPTGVKSSVTLKVDWSEIGAILGNSDNRFRVEYSVNDGGAWSTLFEHLDVNGNNSGTASVALGLAQDLTIVRVRDNIFADSLAGGDEGEMTATLSNIRIEIEVRPRIQSVGLF